MKKLILMMFVLPGGFRAIAQPQLKGSSYEQHFDTLESGLPEGWDVDTNATATAAGGSAAAGFIATPAAATRWGNVSGAFKNVASANGFASFAGATSSLQLAAKDRALGLKQTGSFGDPGAAFVFKINNTFRLSDFKLKFKIQSLDSAAGSRVTTWKVQYGTGDTLHFTTLGTGMLTGGNTYTNTLVSNHFGAALDDQRFPVWIRIVTATASTGAGTRTATAIDDVELSWTGEADSLPRPVVTALSPANGATEVPLGSLLRIRFNRHVNADTGAYFRLSDETDHTQQVLNAADAAVSGKELILAGARLQPGHRYHVTYDSTIADTAGWYTYELNDTGSWRFSVTGSIPVAAAEYFDTSCTAAGSTGWYIANTTGTEQWHCDEYAPGNYAMRIYGYDGITFRDNEDWLISPMLDLRSAGISGISYRLFKQGSGAELQLLVSSDYAGSGSPAAATWVPAPLSIVSTAADTGRWVPGMVTADTLKTHPFYLAFKYTATPAAAYDIRVDSFRTVATTGVNNKVQVPGAFTIVGYPERNAIQLRLSAPVATVYQLQLFNLLGQLLQTRSVRADAGILQLVWDGLDLAPGVYIVKLSNGHGALLQKCLVR